MKKTNFLECFLCIQFFLYCTFLYLDFNQISTPNISSWVKLTSIFICSLYAFSQRKNFKQSSLIFPIYALFFTFLADIFLLLTSFYEIGICLFCLAHILYLSYLKKPKPAFCWFFPLFLFCILTTAILFLYSPYFATQITPLRFFLCLFYFLMLLSNLSVSYRIKQHKLLSLGLILLLLCDIQVVIFNTLSPTQFFFQIAAIGMWISYLPSQVIIVIYIHSRI
jgi:hypothetical protein